MATVAKNKVIKEVAKAQPRVLVILNQKPMYHDETSSSTSNVLVVVDSLGAAIQDSYDVIIETLELSAVPEKYQKTGYEFIYKKRLLDNIKAELQKLPIINDGFNYYRWLKFQSKLKAISRSIHELLWHNKISPSFCRVVNPQNFLLGMFDVSDYINPFEINKVKYLDTKDVFENFFAHADESYFSGLFADEIMDSRLVSFIDSITDILAHYSLNDSQKKWIQEIIDYHMFFEDDNNVEIDSNRLISILGWDNPSVQEAYEAGVPIEDILA